MSNINLHKAKQAKNDEFYTLYEDIEKELINYDKSNFENKIIYCPCDMPTSNFVKYFENNKDSLGYKKFIHTSIQEGYDFRSKECEKYFKEADVVVTNPPFSLFREFVTCLESHKLKYILWSNNNAITYKEIFPLLKDGKLFLGYIVNKTCNFMVGKGYAYDEKETAKINDGNFYGKVPAISVFTNFDLAKHYEKIILIKKYNKEEYPKYDNFDAINVNKTKDIPMDYNGIMGVPITFLDKYNPEQFEIIGILQSSTDERAGIPNLRYYNEFKEMRQDMTYTGASGSKANGAPVLKGKSVKGNFLYNPITEEYVHSLYARIVIKRR